jgi:hypothetical protein
MNGTDTSKLAQTENILEHLRLFGRITPREARENYGCDRLGARIWDLKKRGVRFVKPTKLIPVDNGKHVAQYELENVTTGQTSLLLTGGTTK